MGSVLLIPLDLAYTCVVRLHDPYHLYVIPATHHDLWSTLSSRFVVGKDAVQQPCGILVVLLSILEIAPASGTWLYDAHD